MFNRKLKEDVAFWKEHTRKAQNMANERSRQLYVVFDLLKEHGWNENKEPLVEFLAREISQPNAEVCDPTKEGS